MAGTLEVVLFLLFAIAAALCVSVVFWWERRRREALAAAAARLGLNFEPMPDQELARRHQRLAAMSRGTRPHAHNLLHGTYKGREVRCFDYRFTVQQGKNRHTETHGIILTPVPAGFPRLEIAPETVLHKLADVVGMGDIDFESDEFSRRFWVASQDRRFAYDLIHPRMMEFLLEVGPSLWEIRDGVLCHWQRKAHKPAEIEPALERVVRFLDLVPEYLLKDARAQEGRP